MSFPSERRCAVRRRCKNPDTRPVHRRKQLSLHSLNWLLVQPARTSCNPQAMGCLALDNDGSVNTGIVRRTARSRARWIRESAAALPSQIIPASLKETHRGTERAFPCRPKVNRGWPGQTWRRSLGAAAEFHNREKIPATPPPGSPARASSAARGRTRTYPSWPLGGPIRGAL